MTNPYRSKLKIKLKNLCTNHSDLEMLLKLEGNTLVNTAIHTMKHSLPWRNMIGESFLHMGLFCNVPL